MADSKKYDGSQWEHSLRKQTTASEIIVPPTTIYADGSNITTYTIKGNSVQNGTPTPSAPIAVQGVGELDSGQYKIPISSGGVTTNLYLGSTQTVRQIKKLVLDGTENWSSSSGGIFYSLPISPYELDRNDLLSTHFFVGNYSGALAIGQIRGSGTPSQTIFFNYDNGAIGVDGFKSWLATQYANGTPVTVWYVLTTPETAAVNEPLQKIGDYADILSNATAIPTTEGANSITVDTTVQPSEFTATWTGWHDSSVKEWDGSDWQ